MFEQYFVLHLSWCIWVFSLNSNFSLFFPCCLRMISSQISQFFPPVVSEWFHLSSTFCHVSQFPKFWQNSFLLQKVFLDLSLLLCRLVIRTLVQQYPLCRAEKYWGYLHQYLESYTLLHNALLQLMKPLLWLMKLGLRI